MGSARIFSGGASWPVYHRGWGKPENLVTNLHVSHESLFMIEQELFLKILLMFVIRYIWYTFFYASVPTPK